jgi:hypothetical protein
VKSGTARVCITAEIERAMRDPESAGGTSPPPRRLERRQTETGELETLLEELKNVRGEHGP